MTFLNNNMRNYVTLNYDCPVCNKTTDIEIEVESPSDYYMDTECPECGAPLSSKFLDNVPVEIASELAGRAEYLRGD